MRSSPEIFFKNHSCLHGLSFLVSTPCHVCFNHLPLIMKMNNKTHKRWLEFKVSLRTRTFSQPVSCSLLAIQNFTKKKKDVCSVEIVQISHCNEYCTLFIILSFFRTKPYIVHSYVTMFKYVCRQLLL